MTDAVPRPELDAKLEAIEARMDGRIEAFVARMDERDRLYEQRSITMEKQVDRLEQKVTESIVGFKSMKTTYIVTAVATVLTLILGIAGFNATLVGGMVSSFESGKTTMNSINETTKRLEALQDRMDKRDQAATPAK